MRRLGRSLKQRRGATATETIILVVLVSMVVLASIKVLRDNLGNKVDEANTHVAAVSLDRQDPDEARRKQNEKEAARASAVEASADDSTEPAAADGARADRAVASSSSGEAVGEVDAAGAAAEQPAGGCGGFNPFIIPIFLGLLGLLGYVVMKTKKG